MAELKQSLKMLYSAKFLYEVREGYLNLYDRVSSEEGKNILRFLVQVPVDENCITEDSIRRAVSKIYEKMGAKEPATIHIELEGITRDGLPGPSFSYLR